MDDRKLKILIKAIKRSSKLKIEDINYLVEYVSEIRLGSRLNDFYDFEFLNAIMLLISNGNIKIEEDQSASVVLDKIIDEVKFYLPLGEKTENYEDIKSLIINSDGYVDKELYSLFESKLDYQQVINILNRSGLNDSTKMIVRKYILTIAGLCYSQDEVKREFLSFITGCQNEHGNIEDYFNLRVDEIKRKYGIYNGVDEKKVAVMQGISQEIDSKLEIFRREGKKAEDFEQKVDAKMAQAIKTLNAAADSAESKVKDIVGEAKNEYYKELDRYASELKETLTYSSNEAFRKVVDEASEKIREIRKTMSEITTSANKDILRLQHIADEKIVELESFLKDEPELQRVLKEMLDSKQVRDVIIAQGVSGVKNNMVSSSSNEEVTPVVVQAQTPSQVIVPSTPTFAHPGIIIPEATELTLPSKSIQVLPAFDERIAFNERLDKVLKLMEEREKNGEIFHEKIKELIVCIMEGDFVYVWGPSGSGKSYALEQVASLVGLDMIENGKITDVYSITGYYDPRGQFKATPTFNALYNGKLLNNEEFDNGNTDTHVVLNGIQSKLSKAIRNPMKEYYVTFAGDMRVPINPNFRMAATGNTDCKGENEVYSARGRVDESVQDRLVPKLFLYDNRVEERILKNAPGWYKVFCDFREACLEYASGIGQEFAQGMGTTRDADDIARYLSHNSKSVGQIINEKFVQTKDAQYLKHIRDYIIREYSLPNNISSDPCASKSSGLGRLQDKEVAGSLAYGCNEAILRLEPKKK